MYGRARERLRAELDEIREAGLYKQERVIETPQGANIAVAEREVLNFCANNYLGLANDPRLREAAKRGVDAYGLGLSSVRFICGTQTIHKTLEKKIADFHRKEDTILYIACFDANGGLFEPFLGTEDAIISDALNHASIIDGVRLCKAQRFRYEHGDMKDLERCLLEAKDARTKIITTDGVFSMDGDVAWMEEIRELAHEHDAMVIVDDAHATGILGKGGSGQSDGADVVIGTFSKALGSFGAYVACSDTMRDYLINRCGGFIYSTALPPPVLGAIDAALDLVPSLDTERARVASLSASFRDECRELGYDTGQSLTQIVPLIVGTAEAALGLSNRLREAGLWATAIRPPTVPNGTARVRLTFTAAHTGEDLSRLVEVLQAAAGPRAEYVFD